MTCPQFSYCYSLAERYLLTAIQSVNRSNQIKLKTQDLFPFRGLGTLFHDIPKIRQTQSCSFVGRGLVYSPCQVVQPKHKSSFVNSHNHTSICVLIVQAQDEPIYYKGSTCQVDRDKHNDELMRPRVMKPTNIQTSHTRLMKLFTKRAAHRQI